MHKDALRITAWLRPSVRGPGKYGNITNHQWLELENERFKECGDDCEIKVEVKQVPNKHVTDGETITYEALFIKEPVTLLGTRLGIVKIV